jgi:hypothetical protein
MTSTIHPAPSTNFIPIDYNNPQYWSVIKEYGGVDVPIPCSWAMCGVEHTLIQIESNYYLLLFSSGGEDSNYALYHLNTSASPCVITKVGTLCFDHLDEFHYYNKNQIVHEILHSSKVSVDIS